MIIAKFDAYNVYIIYCVYDDNYFAKFNRMFNFVIMVFEKCVQFIFVDVHVRGVPQWVCRFKIIEMVRCVCFRPISLTQFSIHHTVVCALCVTN